jgi:hypothetical protein
MADERPNPEPQDPLAAERARLHEAVRLLDAERARLRAERSAGATAPERERRRGRDDPDDEGAAPERDDDRDRSRERRRQRGSLLLALLGVDPELCDWWRANRPSRVLWSFLRDAPDDFVDHLRAARREYLLAARSFVDYALEYNERGPTRAPRRGAVPIDD